MRRRMRNLRRRWTASRRWIRALKGEGLSVLLCEQNLRFCEAIADRAYIIEKGQIRFGGTMAELAADQSLREQYLSV